MVFERALEALFTRNKDNENQRSIRLTALVATYNCLTVSAGDTPYSGTNFPVNSFLLANTRLSLLPEQYSHLDSAENHMMQCSRRIQQCSSRHGVNHKPKLTFQPVEQHPPFPAAFLGTTANSVSGTNAQPTRRQKKSTAVPL